MTNPLDQQCIDPLRFLSVGKACRRPTAASINALLRVDAMARDIR